TFYMFRLAFVVFGGTPKSDAPGHAHESPDVMLWPLRILAVFSIIGGVIGIEHIYTVHFNPEAAAHPPGMFEELLAPFTGSLPAAALGLLAFGVGLAGRIPCIAAHRSIRCPGSSAGFRARCGTGSTLTNFTRTS